MTDLAIEAVVVPVKQVRILNRIRKDLGDIEGLSESIVRDGLVTPIAVTRGMGPDGVVFTLVAGERRLRAFELIGRTHIPAVIANTIDSIQKSLLAEIAENSERKPFTPTEADDARSQRERLLRAVMPEPVRGRPSEKVSKLDTFSEPTVSTRRIQQIAATGTGYSKSTLDKVALIKTIAANPETPAPVRGIAQAALADMDRTGNVDKPFRSAVAAVEAMAPVNQAVGADEHLADLNFQAGFARDLSRAHKAVLTYDPAEVGSRVDPQQLDSLDELVKSLTKFAATARSHVSGLRLVSGASE